MIWHFLCFFFVFSKIVSIFAMENAAIAHLVERQASILKAVSSSLTCCSDGPLKRESTKRCVQIEWGHLLADSPHEQGRKKR